ncbi:MAG: hypothetical protein Q7K42_05410 [Candidatus Diapherotrites archaeon]|nr:hypothetical protein [Candidatus Diapherotrites archaeon]
MQFKYCSNCGNIGDFATTNGLRRCSSCKYVGDPLEGGMDEINTFRKKMRSGQIIRQDTVKSFAGPSSGKGSGTGTPSSNPAWKEKLKSMKGKNIGPDAEIF